MLKTMKFNSQIYLNRSKLVENVFETLTQMKNMSMTFLLNIGGFKSY